MVLFLINETGIMILRTLFHKHRRNLTPRYGKGRTGRIVSVGS
jgi:hypothetical protein